MKTIRRFLSLLIVMSLLLSAWCSLAVSAAEAPLYFGRSILAKQSNGKALCYVYDRLVAGINSGLETIDVAHRTYEIDYDEAEMVWDCLSADHPELYGFTPTNYGGSKSTVTYFKGTYNQDLLLYESAIEQRVAEMTADLAGKSDYDKSLILHDRICDAVTYDLDSAYNQTVVSSLVLGESVCAGYARAYQMLLQTVGIPCFYVTGTSKGQGHAWNLVQLDGQWYYTDVTWDDQNDDGGYIFYTYLNNTSAQISEDHTVTELAEYLPKATATEANFYVKNDLVIHPGTKPDVERLATAFKSMYPPQVYYTGASAAEGAQMLFGYMSDIIYEMMGGYYGYSINVSLLGHGMVLPLEVMHTHKYQTETVAASCTAAGTLIKKCGDCGYTSREAIPALGHKMAWDTDSTHHTRYCENCKMVESCAEHNFGSGKTCIVCGYLKTVPGEIGDVDSDGRINNRDLARLQQYLNNWQITVDKNACDVNRDGNVNNRDLARLQQFLNGYFPSL